MGGGKVRNDAAIAIGNWNGSNLFGHPTPFLSRRFSFNFSIVALLQRKYYPRLHTWIQELRRTENLRRGSLSEIRRSRLRIYIYIYTRGGANRVRTIAVFLEYWITGSEMFRWKRMAFRRGENIFGKYLNGTIISRVIYSILSTSKAFYICSVLGHRRNANGKITGQTRRRCRSTEDRMRISRWSTEYTCSDQCSRHMPRNRPMKTDRRKPLWLIRTRLGSRTWSRLDRISSILDGLGWFDQFLPPFHWLERIV